MYCCQSKFWVQTTGGLDNNSNINTEEVVETFNQFNEKIKKFFKKFLFYKKNKLKISNENSNNNLPNSNFKNSIRNKFSEENMKQDMAKKLLYGEIGVSDLNENEVDEMTEYFKNDIKNIDNELIRIKKHILSMQQSLKNKY